MIPSRPAFPTPEFYDEKMIGTDAGMSLRDYFAAKALVGRLSNGFNSDGDSSDLEAAICYQIADAMLVERVKR